MFLAEASMRSDRRPRAVDAAERRCERNRSRALIADQHVAQVMQGHQAGRATPAASLPFPAQRVPENPFAASVVAVDAEGLGVACNFTMNALFGAGRIAPGHRHHPGAGAVRRAASASPRWRR